MVFSFSEDELWGTLDLVLKLWLTNVDWRWAAGDKSVSVSGVVLPASVENLINLGGVATPLDGKLSISLPNTREACHPISPRLSLESPCRWRLTAGPRSGLADASDAAS